MEEYTIEIARKRVARGASLLDGTNPGWWQKVNLETLDISSCTKCTIGQLYGNFNFLTLDMAGIHRLRASTMGFASLYDTGEYPLLTQAWKEEVNLRKLQAEANQPVGVLVGGIVPSLV